MSESRPEARVARLRLIQPAQRFGEWLLDQLYPPRCGGCDRRGTLFCDDCLSTLEAPGEVARGVEGIDRTLSAGLFAGPLREAIHKLKYEGDRPLAKPLARFIHFSLEGQQRLLFPEGPATVIPVPLHRERERQRGYNQARLLARELVRLNGLSVATGLVRTRPTRSQVGLGDEARRQNVRGAFAWQGGPVPPVVLFVDDVCTTGATLSECAACLREAGASIILAATVARAADQSKL
jgi:ComF family protein